MAWFLPGVLGNLFGGPATRLYPFKKRDPFENVRGQIELDRNNCTYCGACSKRCPTGAINVDRTNKLFYFEPFRCIICEACIEICPRNGIKLLSSHRSPEYTKPVLIYQPDGNGTHKAPAAADSEQLAIP